MAEYYSAVTTNQGIALSADLLVGERLVFTKLVAGSGIYSEDDLVRTNLQKATTLREPKQEFGFSSVAKVTDSCVLLKSLLSNVDLTEGYRMTEIGVYAKRQDEEGDGILYSLSVAKEADYFPCYNGLAAVEIIEEYYLTVSDTADVMIQAGSGASVLTEDFERFKEELYEKIKSFPTVRVGTKDKLDQKNLILLETLADTNKIMRILERDANDEKHVYEFAVSFDKAKEREKLQSEDTLSVLMGKIKKILEDIKENCFEGSDDFFVQMAEESYIPPSRRTQGSLYGLITKQRGLQVEFFDRYVSGMENPSNQNTLYGVEATERTVLEKDEGDYRAILSNIVHIEEGQGIERIPGMLYATNKTTQ